MDIVGSSILDLNETGIDEPVEVFIDGKFDHLMYPSVFYRSFKNMNRIERHALQLCKGKILDIGAGAGCHSLYLQEKGLDVTALDMSKYCCRVMKSRGILKVTYSKILEHTTGKFDTILLLMNGLGIAGELDNAAVYLNHIKKLLSPNGEILIDSTDISYTLINDQVKNNLPYFGETEMLLKFRNQEEPLKWLYIDEIQLIKLSAECGMKCVILKSDSKHRFLAQISFEDHEVHP